jgi:hypothetical protein
MLACGQSVSAKGQPKQITNGGIHATPPDQNSHFPPPRSGFVQRGAGLNRILHLGFAVGFLCAQALSAGESAGSFGMSTRAKRILGTLGLMLVCYCTAYFLSVTTTYVPIKAANVAVPVYRPCDAPIVHTVFAPVQLVDASYLRPSRWQERTR